MNIINKTKRPIRVPLPDGKKLFLGPFKTGQITPKSASHPALVQLIEAGDLELDDVGRSGGGTSETSIAMGGDKGGGRQSSIRRTGDR
jgi:hypothetical protein